MKAQIYINRHVVRANKKATSETGELVDVAAIAVNTYLGSVYAKEVEFTTGCKLIQDAANARCSGATIWLESEFESLVIDKVKANRFMFDKKVYQIRETIPGMTAEQEGKLIKEFSSYKEASDWLSQRMKEGESRNLYICER